MEDDSSGFTLSPSNRKW